MEEALILEEQISKPHNSSDCFFVAFAGADCYTYLYQNKSLLFWRNIQIGGSAEVTQSMKIEYAEAGAGSLVMHKGRLVI